MEQTVHTYQLSSRQPFLWVSLGFWLVCALFAWLASQRLAALCLLGFAVLTGLGLTSRASIILDGTAITYRTRFGVHRIEWDEIRRTETDGVALVLLGVAKQLPLIPGAWSSETRDAAQTYLERQLAMRGVPRADNPVASRMTFRNTRVRAR
ncbi:MAG: hypothetical protein AB1898_03495 [Acidobacteriota bacterium]